LGGTRKLSGTKTHTGGHNDVSVTIVKRKGTWREKGTRKRKKVTR